MYTCRDRRVEAVVLHVAVDTKMSTGRHIHKALIHLLLTHHQLLPKTPRTLTPSVSSSSLFRPTLDEI